jgi:hypothetical protein
VEHLNGSPEVMAYSSINAAGSALVWNYGPTAQSLVIGCTLEDKNAGPANGPLNWNELSSDLIVASHFSSTVGIYSLEGCIRQGFLPRLASFDWGQTVTVSADAIKQAQQFRQRVGLQSGSSRGFHTFWPRPFCWCSISCIDSGCGGAKRRGLPKSRKAAK